MTNRPRLTPKTYVFRKRDGFWFPDVDDIQARRFAGFKSKAAVKAWQQDRELYCGEIVTVKFVTEAGR